MVTRLRSMTGDAEVEVAAVLLPEADQDSIGFTLRARAPHGRRRTRLFGDLARAVERLATRLGTHRLPGLMREGTDLIERHLLQAALARGQRRHGRSPVAGHQRGKPAPAAAAPRPAAGGEPTIVGSR
ncbi:MAG: hypothetical protein MZW92_69825 [Comamonadaceae bacterium]|nr:hypothetical protein [Comamonadaceae bacterium]